jgi:hypothetical protein
MTEVNISQITSTVTAVDEDSWLAPHRMERIVRAVVRVMDERDAHRARVNAEQRISGGVREEQEMG